MNIYDQQGNVITNPDLSLGRLEDLMVVIHHPAVTGVQEVFHYETLREYPNGGKDVVKVVDTPGVDACDAWDEEVCRRTYIPYTQEELDSMNPPPQEEDEEEWADPNEERIAALEEQNAMLMECVLEMSEMLYA